jgi:hypothetical protein
MNQANAIVASHKEWPKNESSGNLFKEEISQVQILIAEAENELPVLLREYLSSWGVSIDTANSDNVALPFFW